MCPTVPPVNHRTPKCRKMFSFFRKSKKEPDSSGSSSGGGGSTKKHKDKETNSASPARHHKEMCKNIQNGECANVSVVPSVATEVSLPKTVETETASGENETKTTNDATMSVSSKAQIYASMLKTLDPPQKETTNKGGGGGVKPCGHGTVAIAPKNPLSNKRDHQATPPDSPKAEMRNKLPFYKQPNETNTLHKNNCVPKYELVKTQPMNDTVTGVMKLRVDIPSSPTDSNPPSAESGKYVIKHERRALLF